MRSGWLAGGLSAVALASGCGPKATPISAACTDSTVAMAKALKAAPAAVLLPDGSRLSQCISDGTDDAELQDVGLTFHALAEDLRVRAREGQDAGAAVQLGYLIGATERGAAHTAGVMSELQRRVEIVGGHLQDEAPALAADVQRGLAAGRRGG